MANRILLGQGTTARGGTSKYGLWVSKPGQNVLSCSDDNLIFDMDKGGTSDIRALLQKQTVSGTATASATTTVAASTTTTLSFTNFSWGFGIIPFIGLGVVSSGSSAGQNSGSFTVNSFTTSGINITNLESSTLNISFSILPRFSSSALF